MNKPEGKDGGSPQSFNDVWLTVEVYTVKLVMLFYIEKSYREPTPLGSHL